MLALCGLPVFFLEVSFGQFASLGPLSIWRVNPLFKGVGVAMVLVTVYVNLYYNILVAHILYYFFASMAREVPWTHCGPRGKTLSPVWAPTLNKTLLNSYIEDNNITRADLKTPSEEYFYRNVLQISEGIDEPGTIVWRLALCLLLVWIIIFLVLIKGISSLGKVVYFTSTFPYLMMTVMIVRGATLDGAMKGVMFYLRPQWSRLLSSEVWSDAAAQIFYSLSTCSGGLIAMASYNNFKNNSYRDSILIPVVNCVTSVFAGFSIFTVLGYLAQQKDLEVKDVAASGPGLVFVVYPEGLATMPLAPVWSVLFFFMMLTLGFSSSFSLAEVVFVAILDEFPRKLRATPYTPIIFRGVVCILYFLFSLPMLTNGGFYLFNILDTYAGGFPRLFTGIFELIAIIWVYGFARFAEDVEMMTGHKPNLYFRACWTVIAPLIITGIVIFKGIQHQPLEMFKKLYPAWGDVLGWVMVGSIICWIPVGFFVQWCRGGGLAALRQTASPKAKWGPAFERNRTGRYRTGGVIALTTLSTTTLDIDVTVPNNGDVDKDNLRATEDGAYVNNAYL
ncbi:hypothetical protein NP493_729g00034 [Ridgeia piscesae]|uniref:Uncharacterized protein n=1 Tax=Ridgeia piscesae TaxID=27915 RepID=A0AAD9KRE4_RIDPI|nr:hypothetical protein NP493_729g00034 [Ridgeia piscesae]